MLRVYSIMQLQQVWTKPAVVDEDDEPEVLSPILDVVHEEPEDLTEIEPTPFTIAEEQTLDHAKSAEEPAIKDEERPASPPPVPAKVGPEIPEEPVNEEEPAKTVEEPAQTVVEPAKTVEEPAKTVEEPAKTIEEPAKTVEEPAKTVVEPVTKMEEPVKEPEPVKEEVKEVPQQQPREIPRDTKRDSKVSTMSKDSNFVLSSIAEEGRRTSQSSSERKAASHSPSMTRTSTMDESLPPTPISLKPSRSTQIQGKLSTGRKTISRKLKRAFSVSSSGASSKKRFTL